MSVRQWISRLFGLILITVFAVAVMIASGTDWLATTKGDAGVDAPKVELTATPVLVVEVAPTFVEITDHYSGLLEPLERFRLGFEINGRIARLGENAEGKPLDDGDAVRAGQTLATLDQRALKARVDEAKALADQAQTEFQRAERLKRENIQTITDAEYSQRQTDVKVTQAQLELALKTLDDATLTSKIDGVVSRRFANVGESVGPQQLVFEVVQTDTLVLDVGVPESRITAVIKRFNEAKRQSLRPDAKSLPREQTEFQATATLVAKDSHGRPLPANTGTVKRISQTADETSGLFSVEIEIPNKSHLLRPGQIAIAELIIDRVEGVKIPLTAAQFTNNRAFIYSVDGQGSPVFPPRKSGKYVADRHEFGPGMYLEQGANLVVFDFPAENVVLRGQHRLVDGRPVKVLREEKNKSDRQGSGERLDAKLHLDSDG